MPTSVGTLMCMFYQQPQPFGAPQSLQPHPPQQQRSRMIMIIQQQFPSLPHPPPQPPPQPPQPEFPHPPQQKRIINRMMSHVQSLLPQSLPQKNLPITELLHNIRFVSFLTVLYYEQELYVVTIIFSAFRQ